MADEEKKDKKIIVDEDWKKQAQKEKEELKQKQQQEKPEDQSQQKEGERPPLPRGDMNALISMLATQAYFAMGLIQAEGRQREPDFELARYHIDMLQALEDKTKGNLEDEQAKVLNSTINEMRMVFVKLTGGDQE